MMPTTTPTLTLALAEARAGMVLAAASRDAGGAVLLPQGAVLTESMLASLARRGVASLDIIAAVSSAEREAEAARQCERLERLFRHSAAVGATPALLARLQHYRGKS